MRSGIHLRFLLVAALTASCAGGPKVVDDVDPFQTSREQFRKSTRIVAIADVQLPDGLPEAEPIEQEFYTLIESRLRKQGLTIVAPQQYTAVWEKLKQENGGFVDADTGERKEGDLAIAMGQALKQLNAGFQLDAVFVPTVVVVEAPFGSGRAVWDGTAQSIKTGGVMKGFFAGSPDGTLGALSLRLTVYNTSGDMIYRNAGGIEVLSKLEGKDFVLVPRQELFKDDERIRNAVKTALDPLFD